MLDPETDGKPIPGFDGYRITADGTVWSRWGKGGRKRVFVPQWHVKAAFESEKGHLRVELRNGKGEIKKFFVHRLVLEGFVGPCPAGMECCHDDGNPKNNNVTNLRWGSAKSNWEDRKRHGRGCEGGENPGGGKLTDASVHEIRTARASGSKLKDLSYAYGVSMTMISKICNGKAWNGC